jgi:hypothetical protein
LSQIKGYLYRNRFRLLCQSDRAGEAERGDLLDAAVRLALGRAMEAVCAKIFVDGTAT